MRRLLLLFSLFTFGCSAIHLPVIGPESFEQMLRRTKGVTCAEIAKYEDGEDPPSCQRLYQYHMAALDKVAPYLGQQVYKLRMDNVQYYRPHRLAIPPDVHSPVVSFKPFPIPNPPYILQMAQYGTITRVNFDRVNGKLTWIYDIKYGSEETITCEEIHRAAAEYSVVENWEKWGSGGDDDPMHFDCAQWQFEEYAKNHPGVFDIQ